MLSKFDSNFISHLYSITELESFDNKNSLNVYSEYCNSNFILVGYLYSYLKIFK